MYKTNAIEFMGYGLLFYAGLQQFLTEDLIFSLVGWRWYWPAETVTLGLVRGVGLLISFDFLTSDIFMIIARVSVFRLIYVLVTSLCLSVLDPILSLSFSRHSH